MTAEQLAVLADDIADMAGDFIAAHDKTSLFNMATNLARMIRIHVPAEDRPTLARVPRINMCPRCGSLTAVQERGWWCLDCGNKYQEPRVVIEAAAYDALAAQLARVEMERDGMVAPEELAQWKYEREVLAEQLQEMTAERDRLQQHVKELERDIELLGGRVDQPSQPD